MVRTLCIIIFLDLSVVKPVPGKEDIKLSKLESAKIKANIGAQFSNFPLLF
jgi:hypothetical protein